MIPAMILLPGMVYVETILGGCTWGYASGFFILFFFKNEVMSIYIHREESKPFGISFVD